MFRKCRLFVAWLCLLVGLASIGFGFWLEHQVRYEEGSGISLFFADTLYQGMRRDYRKQVQFALTAGPVLLLLAWLAKPRSAATTPTVPPAPTTDPTRATVAAAPNKKKKHTTKR